MGWCLWLIFYSMGRSYKYKPNRRREVWKKTHGICAHCGRAATGMDMTIDHFIPKSKGGTYDDRNLVPLCKRCNGERRSKIVDPTEYYIFAPKAVIDACRAYKREWERQGRSANGFNWLTWRTERNIIMMFRLASVVQVDVEEEPWIWLQGSFFYLAMYLPNRKAIVVLSCSSE